MKADLGSLQRWFAEAITHRGPLTEGILRAPLLSDETELAHVLTAGPRLSALERLGIYHRAYRARLVECLADDYPAVRATVGSDRFTELVHDYVDRHPSRSPNLNGYGRLFPGFLEVQGEVYLSELARLEWALVEVIHAGAAEPLSLTDLAQLPVEAWANARLSPSDTVRLLSFTHPVNRAFQRFCETEVATVPEPEPSVTLVYRQELVSWRLDLEPVLATLVEGLFGGASLAESLDRLANTAQDDAALAELEQKVMVHFREWVECGVFAKIAV